MVSDSVIVTKLLIFIHCHILTVVTRLYETVRNYFGQETFLKTNPLIAELGFGALRVKVNKSIYIEAQCNTQKLFLARTKSSFNSLKPAVQ